jgi:predicted  nucleic acid-binding Zn-ribbon protein
MKPLNSSHESTHTNEQENKILDKYFSEIKKERYDTSSIPLFDWIENASGITGGRYSAKSRSIYSVIFSKVRQKIALAVFLLIALSIALTVPIKQTQTVANVLSWKINKNDKDIIKKLDNINGIDKNLLTADLNNVGDSSSIIYKLILTSPDNGKIETLRSELANIAGITTVQLTPINESYKKPVFAVVLGKLFDVRVNTSQIDENVARSNINQQLVYAGLPSNLNFDFVPSATGYNIVNASYPVVRDTIRKYYDEKNILIAPDADEIIRQVDKILKLHSLQMDSLQVEINRQLQKTFTPEFFNSMGNIFDEMNFTDIMNSVSENLKELGQTLNSEDFKKKLFVQNKAYLDSLKSYNEEEYKEKISDMKESMKDYEENMKDYEEEMKEGWKEYQEGMEEYKKGMDELKQEIKNLKIELNDEDKEDIRQSIREGMEEYRKGMEEYKDQMKNLGYDMKKLDSLKINTDNFQMIDTNKLKMDILKMFNIPDSTDEELPDNDE